MSVDTPARKLPDTPEPPARRPSGWAALRPLVLRLHFYAGLLIAPFLLVAAVTGGLYAASFQIEKVIYSDQLSVPAADTDVPLSEQVDAALTAHSDGELKAVWPSTGPGATTRVLLNDPSVPEDRSLAVFVDPHTAEVAGALESYGSSGALPFRAWVSNLHRHLFLGEPGRFYSELAASWLGVVALGGVALWLGRRRAQRRLRGTTGRRRTLSLHGTVGLWAALGLLVLSATGLTWSKWTGENIGNVKEQLGGATPAISAAGGGGHDGHGGHGSGGTAEHTDEAAHPVIGIDRVLEIARDGENLSGPLEIVAPVTGEDGVPGAYVVKQTDKQYPHHLDQIAVDSADGEVTDRLDFAEYPLLAKLTRWGIDAHQGLLFGLANQIVLFALAAALCLLIVWGYRMWWQRRPDSAERLAFGRPYPRGALRRLPPVQWLPLLAVTVAVGWFVPLIGLGLLAFLALDVLLGVLARRRVGDREESTPADRSETRATASDRPSADRA
ncbi:PepSY-associated TM helix domain-containing protein [Streptomyces sp. 549]|uniref:PepSY-associated TM helix domain-containing protein n=1 Tax=Streptomyces sp. 549 TaxID=3049076 RepID=UPI0024C302AA|nr:PepSY-associated TM helix domain-containing protein [Streptomyces sp. 549]MDK1474077.1 PepSY-associated TM helix domain-containing protein [Streptomyces sp. 549]